LNKEFPIGIFYIPTWAATNDIQYNYIHDAHINFMQSFYPNVVGINTEEQMKTILDLAFARGIKVQVSDSRMEELMTTATDEEIDAIASSYKHHPATGGYYIKDEPSQEQLSRAAYVYKRLKWNDPNSFPNVNMFPASGVPDSNHKDYLEEWVNQAGPTNLEYLTMDTYPFVAGDVIGSDYFKDMENLRAVGLKYDLKIAAYLQAVGLSLGETAYLRRPNADELRWNVYTNLAYGVKGLYWFTWFQPIDQGPDTHFTTAIMDSAGNKTDLYVPVQSLNEEIKQWGPILMGLISRNVFFKGNLPPGTKPLPVNYFWEPFDDEDQIVSHFVDSNGRNYIMVVNLDFSNNKTLRHHLPSKPSVLTEVCKSTGAEIPTSYSSVTGELSSTFLPGEGKLYILADD
jgi:hypothetical protein